MQQPALESAADRRPAEPELQKLAAGDDAVLGGGELRKQPVDRELPDLRVRESSTRLIPLGGINVRFGGGLRRDATREAQRRPNSCRKNRKTLKTSRKMPAASGIAASPPARRRRLKSTTV